MTNHFWNLTSIGLRLTRQCIVAAACSCVPRVSMPQDPATASRAPGVHDYGLRRTGRRERHRAHAGRVI